MSDDLIVVVPPGTRVRYIENPYTDGKVLVVDAHQLRPNPLEIRFELSSPSWSGLPVYDAEKYADD